MALLAASSTSLLPLMYRSVFVIVFRTSFIYFVFVLVRFHTMESDYSGSGSEGDGFFIVPTTKKRQKTGRVRDVMKHLRAGSHELGPNCFCKRLECFQTVTEENRKRIIREYNLLGDRDKQNSYLSGLITVLPVKQRRPRNDDPRHNEASFSYRVRVIKDNVSCDVQVCLKAFMSLHGISEDKVRYIRGALLATGASPNDGRGKHSTRPHKLPHETREKVVSFLKSLKGRKSHYSLKDTKKIYLPAELNISKLHTMYLSHNPEHKLSYESFRGIFENDFNLSFGYPRKDTCSTCDSFKAQISALEEKLKSDLTINLEETRKNLLAKIRERDIHQKRGERFYTLKKAYRKRSMKSSTMEAITMDFQKNLPCPNITTNDVYYRRQLNFISFNIHILSTQQAVFYTYDESVAKKGADDVCSMFRHFVFNILPFEVRELCIFCDSCAGQNKNYTFIRFLHHLVTMEDRFETIKVIFPIRGHSYLECDRNMSIVKQNSYTEVPEDWRDVLRNTRVKPTPFTVIDCGVDVVFQNWTDHLSSIYPKKCPFPTRPIRMLKISGKERLVFHKQAYFGMYTSSALQKKKKTLQSKNSQKKKYSATPVKPLQNLYNGKLPIKAAKYRDLLHLSQFLESSEAKIFYQNLISDNVHNEESDEEYADDPPMDEELPIEK